MAESRHIVFTELHIRRLRGIASDADSLSFRAAGSGGFSPGIVVVHGPNGAGKTTTALALEGLLWPDGLDAHATISGSFSLDGRRYARSIEGGARLPWRVDGAGGTAPPVPAAELAHLYRLSLHELLQAETGDCTLARRIQREIYGGIDLAAAVRSLDLRTTAPSTACGEYKSWKLADRNVMEATERQQNLRQREAGMAVLQEQAAAAEAARQLEELCRLWLAARAAEAGIEPLRARVGRYDRHLADMSGQEAEEFRALCRELDQERQDAARCRQQFQEAHIAIAATGLADAPIDRCLLGELDEQVVEMRRQRDIELECLKQLAPLREQEERLRATLSGALQPEQVRMPESLELEPIRDYGEAVEALRCRRDVARLAGEWLPETAPVDEAEIDRSKLAVQGLRDWLCTPPPTPVESPHPVWVLPLLAGVAMVLGLVLTFSLHPVFALFVLVPPLILVLARRGREESAPDGRAVLRQQHAERQLPAPASWTPEEVRQLLEALEGRLAQARIDSGIRQRRTACFDQYRQELAACEARELRLRTILREQLGVVPEMHEGALLEAVSRLIRWRDARQALQTQEAIRTEAGRLLGEALDAFNARVEPLGRGNVDSLAGAAALLAELRTDHETLLREREEHRLAGQRIEELEARIARLLARRLRLLGSFGLEDEDAAMPEHLRQLTDWCEALPAYRQAVKEVEEAEFRAREAQLRLIGHPCWGAEWGELTADEVERRAAEWRAQAMQAERLHQQIGELRREVELATSGRTLSAALQQREEALDGLRKVREELVAGCATHLLAEHIRGRGQQQASGVLQRARHMFGAITSGRYDLDVRAEDADAAFLARDTRTSRIHSLDELSSGTRVQLLLAVRLAFLEEMEGDGPKPPLFLDELLANSDDRRADAIIDAVLAMAAGGRQIFYFTAQEDEAGKWRAAAARSAEVPITLIRLQRGEPEAVLPIERPVPAVAPAPEAGESYDDYGRRLGVPRFDPFADVGALHLWYLLDEPRALYRCVRHGFECWGQVEQLMRTTAPRLLLDLDAVRTADELAVIPALAAAFAHAATLWRQGRGIPVDRAALESSGAVSETYIEAIAELAVRCGGDARAILAAIDRKELPGFRTGKRNELESWFLEHGYLDEEPILSPEALRRQLAAVLSASGETGRLSAEDLDQVVSHLAVLPAQASGQERRPRAWGAGDANREHGA